MIASKIWFTILTILPFIDQISNNRNSIITLKQIEQKDEIIIATSNRCRLDLNLAQQRDWLMNYYYNFPSSLKDSYLLRPCSPLTYFTIPSSRIHDRYLNKYFYHANRSLVKWSSANIELIKAICKVIILVFLKIIIKYYVCDYLKTQNQSQMWNEVIDLLSKATTIAIAKMAIKRALYPALRTALKTLLIAILKTLLKPFTKRIKKNKSECTTINDRVLKTIVAIKIKTAIKTTALHLLWLVFENDHADKGLCGVIFKVFVIIAVKKAAKKLCKLQAKKKEQDEIKSKSPPVDQILSFAMQKLVTRLVKIPLILILFE